MNAVTTRMEHDLPGDRKVLAAASYKVHLLRTLENFKITAEIVLKRQLISPEQGTEVLRPAVLTIPKMTSTRVA